MILQKKDAKVITFGAKLVGTKFIKKFKQGDKK
jgi:hypothetical protein